MLRWVARCTRGNVRQCAGVCWVLCQVLDAFGVAWFHVINFSYDIAAVHLLTVYATCV
jgi:hypothetical protein